MQPLSSHLNAQSANELPALSDQSKEVSYQKSGSNLTAATNIYDAQTSVLFSSRYQGFSRIF